MASAETQASPGKQRPLSPHLQIFRPYINMVMSIWHRMTGVALYFGTLLLAWWLIAAAVGPGYFTFVNSLAGSIPGMVVLLGFTWALMHHLVGGLRHLIWDTGRGFALGSVRMLSWLTILLSLSLTAAIWAWVLHAKGIY